MDVRMAVECSQDWPLVWGRSKDAYWPHDIITCTAAQEALHVCLNAVLQHTRKQMQCFSGRGMILKPAHSWVASGILLAASKQGLATGEQFAGQSWVGVHGSF
ncbi:hypothetical protein Y1Q_0007867 [Alligator mississippiensis]|uniref:Uncharacterized protein n=1 Tax=Alligator mississippiensis TaxID=8496 RepID=A0A151NFD9_ALLMI|nr:hypothetical protein Y1Q_0007867 [Alligator mississippiensis]